MIGHNRAAGFGRMSEEVIANFGGKKQMFNLVFSVILEIIQRKTRFPENKPMNHLWQGLKEKRIIFSVAALENSKAGCIMIEHDNIRLDF